MLFPQLTSTPISNAVPWLAIAVLISTYGFILIAFFVIISLLLIIRDIYICIFGASRGCHDGAGGILVY